MQRIRTPFYGLTIGCDDGLITYETPTFTKKLSGPVFEIDGEELLPSFQSVALVSEIRRNANITEYTFRAVYAAHPALTLHLTVRVAEKSPIVKFKYELTGNGTERLTKTNGDKLDYCALRLGADDQTTEVRFSEFNKMIHSFCMNEVPLKDSFFVHSRTVMGPLMAVTDGNHSFLLAYEHGSQYPDAFLHYRLTPAKEIILSAKKGNYLSGTALNEQPFESVWFDFGTVAGSVDDLAAAFREFQLKYVTLNTESRKPYIYYNTWNFQERNKWWNEKAYLADMTEERMLEEIDAAHEMGIEYFVIDTGWYEKTGDWEISTKRFSKDMKLVRERLTSYDMKLGLWIGPTSAGFTSKILKDCPHCELDWNGQYSHRPIWETEESYDMCIVSPFWEAFADRLIALSKTLGVKYFKWDAIQQYGCNSPSHYHGTAEHTPEERADCYAFQLGIYMEKIVNRICEACPDVIVDFDVTEGDRSVGLGFLSVGKYFLINSGPYYKDYNIPWDDDLAWTNIFIYPGAPRSWICRSPLTFDKWIPSVLFLTHYLPDDPMDSQDINLASLILGQNGIWGDLPNVSKEGRARFNQILSQYKLVREDITAEAAVHSGMTGSGFECYEKIFSETGKGVVCVFSTVQDTFEYVTEKKVHPSVWSSVPATVTHLADGTAKIEVEFNGDGAAMIFFGV